MSGVAIATSKSSKPSSMRLARSSAPTTSAPASSASRALSPWAKTAIFTSLPSPLGSAIVPRSCSSAWRTFRPVRTCTSTDSSNFALVRLRTSAIASRGLVLALAVDLREQLRVAAPRAAHEATSTPIERAVPAMILRGLLDVVGVQVLELALRDLAQLLLR